jgi:hypothetical protein
VNYTNYKCAKCGASGCKLWRESYVFLNHVELHCAPCAAKAEGGRDISSLNADGKIQWRPFETAKYTVPTDQIGNMVPAVPTEDGETFWGYTSVPPEGVRWWRELPSLPSQGVSQPTSALMPDKRW